jgi:hypothetical protein
MIYLIINEVISNPNLNEDNLKLTNKKIDLNINPYNNTKTLKKMILLSLMNLELIMLAY